MTKMASTAVMEAMPITVTIAGWKDQIMGAACMSGLPQFGLPRFFAIENLLIVDALSGGVNPAPLGITHYQG
jgi:hypothetical protein